MLGRCSADALCQTGGVLVLVVREIFRKVDKESKPKAPLRRR